MSPGIFRQKILQYELLTESFSLNKVQFRAFNTGLFFYKNIHITSKKLLEACEPWLSFLIPENFSLTVPWSLYQNDMQSFLV